MSAVLVDSNVLLDIATDDADWFAWSSENLRRAANQARLVINPIIFAEVSVHYDLIEELNQVLPRSLFDREPISEEAAFLAGKCFLQYKRRGGRKTSPLPDFFIGAHAATAGYRLITRDVARYRSYFPALELIAPA
jgi:predicted nucleic acid-binding protein